MRPEHVPGTSATCVLLSEVSDGFWSGSAAVLAEEELAVGGAAISVVSAFLGSQVSAEAAGDSVRVRNHARDRTVGGRRCEVLQWIETLN